MSKNSKRRKTNNFKSSFDYLGSYTGECYDDEHERPIQDADDL